MSAMIDNMLLDQSWFAELPLRKRYLFICLLMNCTKCGVFEVNLRKFKFMVDDGKDVTRDDVFSFKGRIKPLGSDKAIFPDYIRWNWCKSKGLPIASKLTTGIVNELTKYGLTIEDVAAMGGCRLEIRDDAYCIIKCDGVTNDEPVAQESTTQTIKSTTADDLINELFIRFWNEYPRKDNKHGSAIKFRAIMKDEKEAKREILLLRMLDSVDRFKLSDQWQNPKFIPMPSTWLSQRRWEDEGVSPMTCDEKPSDFSSIIDGVHI